VNLDRIEARIAETVAWWERCNDNRPDDAARERKKAARVGYVAHCDDPPLKVRASELAELVAVARAAVTLLDALATVQDMTEAERTALAVIEEVVA
jgi:hypothetical protein